MIKKKNLKLQVKKKKTAKIETPSYTPSLNILSRTSTGRALTQETQSCASSPHQDTLHSIHLSPHPEIKNLLKHTLKRVKRQKLELTKIKEIAEKWKKKKKKEIEIITKNDKKGSSKNLRPKTAWDCEKTDRPAATPQALITRRANIGLEFYNLKSPRNMTPKNLQEQTGKKKEKPATKKKITEFIKKKKKTRLLEEKKAKELEEEHEIKRLVQLLRVEKTAKQVIQKRNKGKSQEKKKKIKQKENCFSEDEEVVNIMQVRKLSPEPAEENTGRRCVIFGNDSEMSKPSFDEKRVRSEDFSIAGSSSMPIIELRSISRDSSSDNEKKVLVQRMEKLRNRARAEVLGKLEKCLIQLFKVLQKVTSKRVKKDFFQLKLYEGHEKTSRYPQYIRSGDIEGKTSRYPQELRSDNNEDRKEQRAKEVNRLIEAYPIEVPSITQNLRDYYEFPSFSREESEEIIAEKIQFHCIERPFQHIYNDNEPDPAFLEEFYLDEVLKTGQLSPGSNNSVVSPDSEIEEFCPEILVDNSRVSPYKSLDFANSEDKIIENAILLSINSIYSDCISIALNDLKKTGNNEASIISKVFTTEIGLKASAQRIWFNVDEDILEALLLDPKIHLFRLGNFSNELKAAYLFLDKALVMLNEHENGHVKVHNKCVKDLIDWALQDLLKEVNSPIWSLGKVANTKVNFDLFFDRVMTKIEDFSRISAGKIPTPEMVSDTGELDEDLLQALREQGLERILTHDIFEYEAEWVDYDIDEKLTIFQLADYFLSVLIEETDSVLSR